MVVLKGKDLGPVGDGEAPEEVEDGLIKDSVLEMVNTNFALIDENEDLPMGNIRKNISSTLDDEEIAGKPISRDRFFKEDWGPEKEENSEIEDIDSGSGGDDDYKADESKMECDEEPPSDEELPSDEEDDESGSESEIEDDDVPQSDISPKKTKSEGSHEISIYSAAARDVTSEIERGKAIKNQICIWENLLECRIKLQKALVASNKLYQTEDFKTKLTPEELQFAAKTYAGLVDLLETFVELQNSMVSSNVEFLKIKDEILGESTSKNDEQENNEGEPTKKKKKLTDYSDVLNETHRSVKAYRDPIIQKWNDKTRVLSGRVSSSDFSAFEQSTLKQIEQILCDKTRLIRRTQLKRSTYHVLGKEKEVVKEPEETEEPVNKKNGNQDEYDTEIFDDDDFYHKLLRDFIEKKSSNVTDPHQLGRQWTELQKLRSKMKRKVDTRATKGRRLRYTVHNKLVNFMAPMPYSTWTDEGEAELYKSLFGNASLKI